MLIKVYDKMLEQGRDMNDSELVPEDFLHDAINDWQEPPII